MFKFHFKNYICDNSELIHLVQFPWWRFINNIIMFLTKSFKFSILDEATWVDIVW